MTFGRILLARRRIDPLVLSTAAATVILLFAAGKAGFIAFAACGFYLVLARHRVCRHLPPLYSALLLAYVVWAIGLSLGRGEPVEGNRQLGYALVELSAFFIPVGICLVRRPLDAIAIGARMALPTLLVASVLQIMLLNGERLDLGENAAILAFLVAGAAVMARIDAAEPPRFLPNGRWWAYLAIAPILLTQTRGAWIVFLPIVIIDLWALFRGDQPSRRMAVLTAGLAGLVAASFVAYPLVTDRVSRAVEEMERFNATGSASGSVDVRLTFWNASLKIVAEHPVTGVGAMSRMERVAELSGPNAERVLQFQHLHNMFLDEVVSNGLVGLALLMAIFAAFALSCVRFGSRNLVANAAVFVFLVFSFGAFHGVLLNEWMIIAVFGFMGIVLTSLRRTELALTGRRLGPSS
jgi:O-antigen ligase